MFNMEFRFLGLQETRITLLDLFRVRSMWGNFNFGFAFISSCGRSIGLLVVWDLNVFIKNSVVCTIMRLLLDVSGFHLIWIVMW